jgi:hypothetical protein
VWGKFWRGFLSVSLLLALAGCDEGSPSQTGSGAGGGGKAPEPQTAGQASATNTGQALAAAAVANIGTLNSDIGPQIDYANRGSVWSVDQIVKASTGVDFNTLSTAEMYNELRNGMGIAVDPDNPPPGAIIISPTEGDSTGHVGIVGNDGLVYSNDPVSGTWEPTNTLAGWHDSFDGTSGTYAFLLNASSLASSYTSGAAVAPDSSVSGGPVGGIAALGDPAIVTSSTAKINTDGDPAEQGYDATWQAQTSGGYNSALTSFVVVTKAEMLNYGASMGDWALVTNNATGQQAWARVGDVGPADGSGEISEAAASTVGIQFTKSSATVGNPSVTVRIYPGTKNIRSM